MSIVRQHRHEKGFAAIDNRTIRDGRLSFKATGILAHLLSLPDGAPCSAEALAADRKEDGVKAIRSGLDELAALGYLERTRSQGEGGRWSTEIHVYERPSAVSRRAETASRSDQGKQANAQVAPTGPGPIVGEGPAKDLKTKPSKDQPQKRLATLDHFERFWTYYPNKKGKGAARRAWEKRVKAGADPAELIRACQVFAAWCVEAARIGELESMRYVAHPATWLNQEREQDHLTRPGKAPAAGKLAAAEAEYERHKEEERARRAS